MADRAGLCEGLDTQERAGVTASHSGSGSSSGCEPTVAVPGNASAYRPRPHMRQHPASSFAMSDAVTIPGRG